MTREWRNRQCVIASVNQDSHHSRFVLTGESEFQREYESLPLSHVREAIERAGWHPCGSAKLFNGRGVPVWRSEDASRYVAVYEQIRWTMWVDLCGFRARYRRNESSELWGLHNLMRDILWIGKNAFPGDGERLFVHQVGDAFVIKADFGDPIDLERPLAVAIALLRSSIQRQKPLKIGIGLGGFADVQGCYPPDIRAGYAALGSGLMRVFTVLGEGIIDAYEVSEKAHGPVLVVRPDLADVIPSELLLTDADESRAVLVDWVHATLPIADTILCEINRNATSGDSEELVRQYVQSQPDLPTTWSAAALRLAGGYA